jgi:DNA-binding NarL/FixJ family response regulator
MEKIRVLIADDHPAFREGLCRLLEDEKDLECVAKPSDGEEAVRLAKELQPDVAIIDVAMPKLNGIEAAKQIKAACPTIAILMVSAFSYESYMLASLRVGAAGYLLKSAPLRELINAIHSVHAGEGVFDLKVASKILRRLATERGEERKGLEELQRRELEVLKLAAKGMSNKEIAGKLVISERTVQTHLVNIFRKLEVGSRTEAVLHALKEGWLTMDDLP